MSDRALVLLLFSCVGLYGAPADSVPNSERMPALAASVQPQNLLLDKARLANTDLYATLKSFVCREEIDRFKGNLKASKGRTIDHVSASLSFENGVEHYRNILQNTESRASLSDLSGAWSEGEFGTLLQQTGKLLQTMPVSFVEFSTLDDNPTAIYRFNVMESNSPWDLEVGPQHYRIPFTTDVWISVASGEIVKIARKSISMPLETRISEIDWDVTLNSVDLNGQDWLLPTGAAYSVAYADSKRREWNKMSFSNYRRYGSESTISFNGF